MTISLARLLFVRALGKVPSLLLLLTLCLSPSGIRIGVNGLSPPRQSHTCTRNIRGKYRHGNRLYMTASASSNAVDNSEDDLPKLKKKLTREFFSIGFPAFIQLAAEPLAALVVCNSFTITQC